MIHKNLKRIREKIEEGDGQEPYQVLLDKFAVLCTYENTYLMKKMSFPVVLRRSGEDMLLHCGGFGILVEENDKISIHT